MKKIICDICYRDIEEKHIKKQNYVINLCSVELGCFNMCDFCREQIKQIINDEIDAIRKEARGRIEEENK